MSPAKRRTKGLKDIRSFFARNDLPHSSNAEDSQPGGATASETVAGCRAKVKDENTDDSLVGHLHRFKVKLSRANRKEYAIDCVEPCTVLDTIKSSDVYKNIKCLDENIVIQLGKEDKASTIATHFPCTCIEGDECLIISCKSERVEEVQQQHYKPVHPRNRYSVFYIDREGGVHTKSKELFRNSTVKKYKYLCVYGEKGMSVEEAVKGDGRFLDLGDFSLSDNDHPDEFTHCKQRVDKLHERFFKICLPLKKRENDESAQESPGASGRSQRKCGTRLTFDVNQQSGISVKSVLEKSDSVDTEEIYERLRQQFPELKELMKSRFSAESYQETLELRKQNFGKIQQSFSEVYRVKKLLNLGRSVCKVKVQDVCDGTGFVLFDNFILTNAHLFDTCVEGEKVREDINVYALFNYEEPEPDTNYFYFSCKKTFAGFDAVLDYAVLELNSDGQKHNRKRKQKIQVPPGLLKKFAPIPNNGEACLIGHPKGNVKQMDPTCIIEKKRREQVVIDHLKPHEPYIFTITSIKQLIINQGIEDIMKGSSEADNIGTYPTFMYHGASGSPVFDAQCRVFGLHTAGFTYGFPGHEESVIEYSVCLLSVFKSFVSQLREGGKQELLERVEQEAKDNNCLMKLLNSQSNKPDEPMDIDE